MELDPKFLDWASQIRNEGTPDVAPIPPQGGANGQGGMITDLQKLFLDSNKVEDTSKYSYDTKDVSKKYAVTYKGVDNEEVYAQGQGWTDKMVNGVGKGLLLTGTTFLQSTVGLVNGLVSWAADGRAASFYDNDFNRNVDAINKKAEEEWMPNYYTHAEKDADWYSPSKLFSANFFWDGIVKNLGFAAGAALSGGVFSAALKAIPLTAKLFSVGKAAEALAATEQGLLAAEKTAGALGKVKSLSDKFVTGYSSLTSGGRAVVAGLATTGEAGFEAYNNLNEFRNKKIEEYKATHSGLMPTDAEMAEINQLADSVGNSSFLLNTGLLSATNYIQFPKILGSSARLEKGMVSAATKEIGEVAKDAAGNLIVAPSRYGKILGFAGKAASYAFSPSEAFEEGAQFAIQGATQDYYNKKYKGDSASFIDSLTEGVSKTLTTNEGMENILIGGLSGALMMGRGKYTEEREIAANTAKFVTEANKWKLSGFTQETVDSINRGTVIQEEREGYLRQGDTLMSKEAERDYMINYLTPRIKYGRLDLVKSDIADLKLLAFSEDGFNQLVQEGKALTGDTQPAYLQRLTNLETTADSMNSLYQSLTLRYSNILNDEGKPLYNQEVMSKMIYAATKVADYDVRIPQLSGDLATANIAVEDVINDVAQGSDEAFNKALADIDALKIIDDEKIDLKIALQDVKDLTQRRQDFLKEYSDIKNSPAKYTTISTAPESTTPSSEEEKKTVKIKTKAGEKEIEIGTEYFLGRVVEYDKDGKEVYRFPRLTVLGENEDGTIKIKDANGLVRDVSKDVLADYKLGKVSAVASNENASFYMRNMNKPVYWNTGREKAGRLPGRLVYDSDDDKLYFVYKQKGKLKEKQIGIDSFTAKEGFAEGIFTFGKPLTAEDNSDIQKRKDSGKTKLDQESRRGSRLKILSDLFDEVSNKLDSTKSLLQQKYSQFEKIVNDLTKLEQQIKVGELTKTNTFKKTTNNAIKAANRLSRMQEQLRLEIADLEAERDELELNQAYIFDLSEGLDELPTDSKEFLEELKEQRDAVEDLVLESGKTINSLSKLLDNVEGALKTAVDFALDLIRKFESKYPNLPYTPLGLRDFLNKDLEFKGVYPDYQSYLQANPNLLADLTEFERDIADIDELDVVPNERSVAELKESIQKLYDQINEAEQQLRAKNLVLDRFSDIAETYKKQQAEEKALLNNKKLREEFLGTNTNDVQTLTAEDNKGYEAAAKKGYLAVVGGTSPINVGKAHQIRANNFGFRLPSLPNRDDIFGLVVTSKTEEEAGVKGLMEHLYPTDPGSVIALVMVQKNEDGTFSLVDEFGNPIPAGTDTVNNAIYQVFPKKKLTATYNGEVQSMFRDGTPDNIKTALTEQFAAWRDARLAETTLGKPKGINASFGVPSYVKQLKPDGTEGPIDYAARTSATDAGLISKSDLSEDQVIMIATTNTAVSNGSVTFNTPLGRVFLKVPGGLVKLFNRKFNQKEADTIFDVIHQAAKNAVDDKSIKTERTQTLFNWLKSVAYWGIAKNTQTGERKPAGYNNIWFEDITENGVTYTKLFISGKGEGFAFTPSSLETNRTAIVDLLKNMYFNANATLTNANSYNKPYQEIVGLKADGTPEYKRWDNYQTFLLSSEGRSKDEVPFTTVLKPQVEPGAVNRKDIYFTLTDTVDDYVLPSNEPVVTQTPLPTAPIVSDDTKTSIEGLNERLDSYGNATLVFSSDFFEGERPKGKLNGFKSLLSKLRENIVVLADVNWNDFDFFLSKEDIEKLNALKPLAEELDTINTLKITSRDTRTVAVEKRYAALTNQLANEFVDIVGKHVEQQLGKKITSSKPKLAALEGTKPQQKATDPGVFILDGEHRNTLVLNNNLGTVYFTADLKTYNPATGTVSINFESADEATAEKLLSKLGTEDKVKEVLAGTILSKIKPQLEASTIPVEAPLADITPEEQDDWNDNPVVAPDDKAYRLKLVEQIDKFEGESWKKVEEFLKANFPNIPVYRVKNVIKATNGRQAWGMLHKGAIYVYENAEVGTAYHEVFEAVWKMFSDAKERKSILSEFKGRKGSFVDRETQETVNYKDATDQQIKEQLAEEFRDFVLKNRNVANPTYGKSFIQKMFAELVNFIRAMFYGSSAQTNTANLFAKIGNGYYKDLVPYESPLSFAQNGIIDIDQAEGDASSEFRLDNIPAVQQHEIMQQMTYSTLSELSKTNNSLFSVPNLPKAELYARLKTEIKQLVRWKGSQIETAVKNKETTAEKAARDLSNIKALYANIEKDWNDIVKKHEEYLKTFSIEFDENDELELTSDEKGKADPYGDSRKIDSFRKANNAIKLLVGTLPVMEMTAEGPKIKRTSIGGAMLMPSDKVFITLMNTLHTSVNIDDMLKRLKVLAEGNPNYSTLYERIMKPKPDQDGLDYSVLNNEHDLQLITSFWRTFKKQSADVRIVFVLPSGDVVIGDSTLASAAKQSRNEMSSAMITKIKSGTPYMKYNEKEKLYQPQAAVSNVKLDPTDLTGYTKFLSNLGVEFDPKAVKKMKDNQVNTFRDAVQGIRSSLIEATNVATLNSKTLSIDGQLLKLGSIKAILENPEFESTYFNLNGERAQTFIGTNAVSDLYDVLFKIKNINELNTNPVYAQYKYLLTDKFAKGSHLLNRMFNLDEGGTGNRRKNSEELLKTAYVDGTIDENSGKKKESSKLNLKQRIIQEINLNLDGYYMNLVPGDASIEWMAKLGNAISEDMLAGNNYEEVYKIMKEYFMSEVELSRSDRPIVQDAGETRNSRDLRFFKSILGDKLHKAIIAKSNDNLSPDDVYKKYKSDIEKAIKDFIVDETAKTEESLRQYGIIFETEEGTSVENLSFSKEDTISKEDLTRNLKALTINYMIANIELHKLVYSDPYQYKDELKRIKNFLSPRTPLLANSKAINQALNTTYNKEFEPEDKIGYTDFLRDYFRSITLADVISFSDLPGYVPYKETDGGGLIMFKANRNLRLRAGQWNADEEKQYKYDVKFEKLVKSGASKEAIDKFLEKNPGVMSAYTPVKPIVSGNKINGRDYNDIVLDKFALFPLSFRILYQINPTSNAIKLYNKMQAEDIDYGVFASGRKVGAEKLSSVYDSKGKFNEAPFETPNEKLTLDEPQGVTFIPYSILGIQAEVPSKEAAYVTQGSQITKLATMDFMEAGVPIDFEPDLTFDERFTKWIDLSEDEKMKSELYKEIKNNQNLLQAKIEEGYKSLLNKLGIKETETTVINPETNKKEIKKSFTIGDREKLANALQDEILKREVNENIIEAFDGFKKGDVVLEATPAYQQVRNILYSIADKSVVSPKISGGQKVQIPSSFLESERIFKTEKGGYENDLLKFYKNAKGERVCEIMVGRWFKSDLSDEALLEYLNNTPEGQKILAGVGFRIPTQKQNSIDVFRIAKFLPKEAGDSVVIPSELVQKAGSDFDIDKLSLYFKNVYMEKGYPKLVPFLGTGEKAKDKIKQYIIDNKLNNDVDDFYKESLENEYIQSLENLISHPLNFDNLIKPNSAKQLEDLSIEINKKLGEAEIDYSSTGNMLSRSFMTGLRQAFVSGKYAIGIAATAQTLQAQFQRFSGYIDYDKLNDMSPTDQKWLGDGEIKFAQYNKVTVPGKGVMPSLSMIKNKAGEYISDIIGQFIDGYVDIAKGPWIMRLGATPNVASTWLFLAKIGVPIKTVAYFMNQPIVRDYLRTIESNGYSYLFIDKFFNDLQDIYTPSEQIDVKTLPSETDLGKMVGKKVLDMTPVQRAQQAFVLKEFVKYAKLAEHLFQVTQGSNFDTATINDPYLVFKKMMQLKKARNTMISSVDDVLDNSFVGFLKDTISNVRDAFATVLVSDKQSVREVIESVLTPFIDLNDRDFVKVAQKAVNDLFDWAVQTDRKFNMGIEEILLGKGDVKSAAKQVIAFQKEVLANKEHPLYNNMIINSIRMKPGEKENAPDNLFLIDKASKVYDQNLVIYSFRELSKHLGTEGKDLYKKLVRLAVLQSGLTNSPISFTSLLPYEDFKEEYNESLVKLENIPNLAEFSTLNVFQRNNWNNTSIVPAYKAKWKKSKKGNWYSKPNAPSEMSFIDKKLKKAVGDGVIPKMLNFSTLSAEGRSDFLVFSWENGQYTKEQKKQMRKKGNYSYIDKGLFQRVYKEDGEPLIQTSTDKEGNIYESFVYKAINAWGDSFRANEFYTQPIASKLDNGFIKMEDKSETITIPGTSTTYKTVNSAEVDDSIIEQILIKNAIITKPQVIPTGVQPKVIQTPKAVSGIKKAVKEFKVGEQVQDDKYNVWKIISQEEYQKESKLGMKAGVKVRFITNVNPNEARKGDVLNPDSTTYIKPNSVNTLGENTMVTSTQPTSVTKSDAEIRASKEYQDWLKANENPLMSEQENLEYYKVCKL